ncbi:MAG: hypothetical protein OEW33_04210 [Nitrospirota bacterium]|nr:hypothetical protein [Nitrospirota bacterium]
MEGLEDEADVPFTESGEDEETVFSSEEGTRACGSAGGMEESGFISLFFIVFPYC